MGTYGYYDYYGEIIGNVLKIDGGLFNNSVYGGYSHSGGNVNNNVITINNGIFNGGTYVYILGGYSYAGNGGDVSNNTVTINGGTFNRRIYGGYSNSGYGSSGDANNNTLIINDGTFDTGGYWLGFCGGYGRNASGNTVTINGGTFEYGNIYGGYSAAGESNNNTVNIYGGEFNSPYDGLSVNIYGGDANYGNSTNNAINIYGSPNLSLSSLYGGNSYKGTISGNTLNIYTKNLTAQNIYNFDNINFYLDSNISNGDTMLTLTNGNTDISNADITAVVQGGSPLTNGDIVTLLKNEHGVTEAKSYADTLAEGVSLIYPMTVKRANDGNRIILGIGNFVEDSETDDSEENTSTEENPSENVTFITPIDDSNNIVNLYSTNSGTIYGGYTDSGNASNNTVNLYGGTNLENIYGGYAPNGSASNNTLNVYNKNLTAQNLSNFSAMNFYIPNDASNGDTMLTLTDSSGTDLSGVAIRAGVVAGNSNLVVGDKINLLTNPNGLTTDSATSYGRLTEGVSLDYGLTLSNSGNSIVANVKSSPNALNSVTESLPLSTGVTGIAITENVIDSKTLPEDKDDSENSEQGDSETLIVEPKGYEIFANMGGGSLRTKAGNGSYVDMTSQSINLGFARSFESSAGKFTIAPIIDYARGNYDSYLIDGTHGSGTTKYIAGGLIARRILQNGFYYETSFRAGKVKTDFSSSNIDKSGAFGTVTYDTSATALSGHLKLGKAFRLNKNNLLDVYGIYSHAHQGGMSANLSSGEHYNFSSANSGRFRIGYRLSTRTSKISRIYTGLAFQYEHSSGITATYKDYKTPSAGDNGSSGMLEIGWIIKPLKVSPWAVDINATGWIGHQRGVTAFAKIQKAF